MKATNEYLKERYNEEKTRFDHLENKSAKLLTFITAVIAALTAVAGMNSGAIFHPNHPALWLALITFLLGSFTICCAWGHALLSLKVGDIPTMPKSPATADWLKVVGEDHQNQYIFKCYRATLSALSEAIDQKSVALQHAYTEIVISACMLAITAVLHIAMELTQ
ncbi:hypothetical protein [Pseudomonas schmalbachii]|uniref:SMODS and SLOG-associating 2TM effector domain-containing protein n=1 Tax=Pseudomonas schmalbachii TaxID=2816993 RepID=A0ABS3TS00_9PSED|nr:hypothetical protein [Pseudomonas schmalbachii]MBO3276457.1 hypothetical protein [Pseudomonas schmalbachii]